jgi:hypothetical protein
MRHNLKSRNEVSDFMLQGTEIADLWKMIEEQRKKEKPADDARPAPFSLLQRPSSLTIVRREILACGVVLPFVDHFLNVGRPSQSVGASLFAIAMDPK